MGEKAAYNHLRNHLPLEPKDRFDRVENVVGSGFPDINCCIDGIECWIECKAPVEPMRERTPLFGSNHPVLQSQKNWMVMQQQAGGNCWIYIRTDKRAMLISGAYADEVNKMSATTIAKHSVWSSMLPVKRNIWTALRAVLRTKS